MTYLFISSMKKEPVLVVLNVFTILVMSFRLVCHYSWNMRTRRSERINKNVSCCKVCHDLLSVSIIFFPCMGLCGIDDAVCITSCLLFLVCLELVSLNIKCTRFQHCVSIFFPYSGPSELKYRSEIDLYCILLDKTKHILFIEFIA